MPVRFLFRLAPNRICLCFASVMGWVLLLATVSAQTTNAPAVLNRLVMVQGQVEILRAGTTNWVPASRQQVLAPGDRVRTGERSRAEIFLGSGMTIRKGELSEIEIPPGSAPTFRRGIFQIFNRQPSPGAGFNLPKSASAAIRGTDFLVRITTDETSEITVLDGEVALKNAGEEIVVGRKERGVAKPGQAPVKSAVLEAVNDLIQWNLYYPAVVEPSEFGLTADERQALAESLSAYQNGDVIAAVDSYSWNRVPISASESVYRAALLLSVGQVEPARAAMASAGANSAVRALTRVIEAVKMETSAAPRRPVTASEWLAESYYEQSVHHLDRARSAAEAASTHAPAFGFAWARLGELEFSFGRIGAASSALDRALRLSPRHAPALALDGFLRAARGRNVGALERFDQAIAVDATLGNAWLGRGLCQIHQGQVQEGLHDLIIAASLEPQRSLLRSYLGKAFAQATDFGHAEKELRLAVELDPRDPTPWLYSALLHQQQNRFNESIAALEQSQDLNDNRQLYRSRHLLDEDRAVRSANLAGIYLDAGMPDVSLHEAARAVGYDSGNYSSHLFLADSYDLLRDPTRFNLRYETVWFNELLLANILAPAGAGRLSQGISSHEYSRLFESDGLGLESETMVRSDGIFNERASQFGAFGNTSYALDLDYRHQDGVRPNNELDRLEWYTTVKQQVTAHDSALLLVKYEDYHSGDNFQYYDPQDFRRYFKFEEHQEPILAGAWHHEWSPGHHTLFLGARLVNDQEFSDRAVPQILLLEDASGAVTSSDSAGMDVSYRNSLEVYSAELSQMADLRWASLTAGGRYQSGEFRAQDALTNPDRLSFLLEDPPAQGSTEDGFERVTGYGYLTLKPLDSLRLIGGVAWDQVTFPHNFRHPPVTTGEEEQSQVGPKAGIIWTPVKQASVRGAYTRSLGGVSLDESYRLEPTQLAGFPQAFRTLIPESVAGVGSVSAPEYETMGLALDLKLGTRTYVGLQVERLRALVRRDIGVFTAQDGNVPATPDSIRERLDFEERSLALTVNQLIGREFMAGATYTLTRAMLDDEYDRSRVPSAVLSPATPSAETTLHRVGGHLLFSHPSGWYSRGEVTAYLQSNSGYSPGLPGTDVVQENIYLGYRFLRGRGDVRLGILNLSDQDYHLNPLSAYEELPRERVVEARLSFRF